MAADGQPRKARLPDLFPRLRNRHGFSVVFLKVLETSSCVGQLSIVKSPIVAVFDSSRGRDTRLRSAFQQKPSRGGTIGEAGQLGGMGTCNE
jgi:hypothetical protein